MNFGRMVRRGRRTIKRGDKNGMIGSERNKFQTVNGDIPVNTSNELMMGADDYRDLRIAKFIANRMDNNISTITEKIEVIGNNKKAMQFVRTHFANHNIYCAGTSRMVIESVEYVIEVESNTNTIDFRIHSTFTKNDELREMILREFEEVSIYIRWIYDTHMSSISVPIDLTLLPMDEMYPSISKNETLKEYYQRFMDSTASILILTGPPGTGKTSFIRGLLAETESSAIVTYDPKILANDGLFSEFVESSSNVLVIEDADIFLAARSEGNDMMHKFLNVGDGLVTVKGKKMIFTTNLPSIKDIDSALLRPGRCFDVLHLGELQKDDAEVLVNKLNLSFDFDDRTHYSISELFSGVRNTSRKAKSKFGFLAI